MREGRFTREQLDKNPEFTVNVPMGDYDKNVIAVCGMKSGRDTDKIAEAVAGVLATISTDDLEEMINDGEEIEVKCYFCNSAYKFSTDELKEIADSR